MLIHEKALCESTQVGEGTRVWAFTHVLPGARIGRDCNIGDGVFIESDVVVGDRVTVKSGVQLWNGVRLGNDVFVGPNATFSNDIFPRHASPATHSGETVVEDGASIGANATIAAGITIGRGAVVGAGSVVTRSVPPNAVVEGNPGHIVGYVTTSIPASPHGSETSHLETSVNGAGVVQTLPVFSDMRGALTVGNFGVEVPFTPARFFMVYGVPSRETRGEHAHRVCHQYLICVAGSCRVLADNGVERKDVVLDAPSKGLHLPPMTWGTQYDYSKDAVLLVFASHPYDADEYIRTYEEFRSLTASAGEISA